MNRYLGTLVASALLTFGALTGSLAETATLLPNAVQQFFDNNGKPLATGTAGFYVPNTLTPKTVWTSADESVPQTNPVPLTLSGRPTSPIYGSGIYRQIVKDKNEAVIWDALTAATDSGGGGVAPAFSEGVMVGTIIPWANMILPAKYLYTAGQAISRATYPNLYTALTFSTSILCQNGIATITVSTDISDKVPIGTPVEFACFAPGTTVIAKSSGTLTMSTNATSTTSVVGTLFPWGNGNGSTTFNVPNINGRTIVGRDNMNGGAAGVLTSTYYKTPGGTGVNPDAINAVAGSQSNVLVTGNLPPYTPAGAITNGAITSIFTGTTSQQALGPGGGSEGFTTGSLGHSLTSGTVASSQATSTLAGTPQGGTSVAFTQIQPSVTADYIIKALPDDTPGGPGVSSIQGMTGAIACGTNMVCTANVISVTIPPITSVAAPFTIGAFVVGTQPAADAITAHSQQILYFPSLASDPACLCNTFLGNGGLSLNHSLVNTNSPFVAPITITVTIATPAVVTWSAHGFGAGTPVAFTTSGALPTGIVSGTTYYVAASPAPTLNTFSLAATVGGVAINTSGGQSGVQSGFTISLEGRYNNSTGQQALQALTNGSYDVAYGFESMFSTTSGSWNTALGEATLFTSVLGNANVAVGWKALLLNTDSNNTAIGFGSMLSHTVGQNNVALGYRAAFGTVGATMANDTAIGAFAGTVLSTGTDNTLLGSTSGLNLLSGSFNTFVGSGTGSAVTTGGSSTLIGANQAGTAALANEIRLSDGTGALGFRSDASRNTYLGDSAVNRNVYNYFSSGTNNAGTTADSGGVWHVFTGLTGTANWLNVYPDGGVTVGAPTGASQGPNTLNSTAYYLSGVVNGPYLTATRGQLPGVTSNTLATAGNIGELVVNSANFASSTVTITIAAPAVITWTGWRTAIDSTGQNTNYTGGPVTFTTTGALPTGIVSGTTYYIVPIDANTFNIATSVTNAFAGTKVTTSGAQSGVQTALNGINLTSTVNKDFMGLSLTAGEWDVSGVATYLTGASTTLSYVLSGTGTASGTVGGIGSYNQAAGFPATAPGAVVLQYVIPTQRYSLSATSNIFCIAGSSFAVSTLQAYGQCRATRVH